MHIENFLLKRFTCGRLQRYGIAFLCAAFGLWLRLRLNPSLGTEVPYITFFPAIMLSAWAGGLGPGLITTALSALAARYYAINPLHSFALRSMADALGFGLFLGVSTLISALNESVRNTQQTSAKHLQRLQEEMTKRDHAQQMQKESQERLQLALDAANEGLWDWNVRTGAAYYSPRYYILLGYEANEWTANYETWLGLLHPDDRPTIDARRTEQINRQGGVFDLEYRLRTKTGEYAWVQSRGKVIEWGPDGAPARIVGTVMDITGRKKLEEQFQQVQRLDSIGRLAGGVAHDFNNLLTVINGYAEIAAKELPPNSSVRESLGEIRMAGERAADLTRQLLAFSRKQLLQPVVVNLNHVVTDITKMLQRLIGENISMVVRLAPDLGNIRADAGQLQQVIINLAINSRDAMPNGGTLMIETANVLFDDAYTGEHPQVPPGHHVMLAITDNGSGMTKEVQERIFEPFFTTKPKGSGTGLGLATVYGIVRQMDGWIWVYSEIGQGTTFKVYFSRTDEAASISSPILKTDLRGVETILVVEDQAEVRNLTVTALKRYGYAVFFADDAEQAIEFCRKHAGALDLVITDIILPGINGRELARQLLEFRPELRVLFMSGYTDNAVAHHEVLDEGVEYLQKPFTPDGLAEKVREVLGPHQCQATILLVEDDELVRGVLRRYLVSSGYAVLEAVNGRQALELVAQTLHVDLVITDMVMPEQEGSEIIGLLHKHYPLIRIIAISGAFDQEEWGRRATQLDVDAALCKPISREELISTVRTALQRR